MISPSRRPLSRRQSIQPLFDAPAHVRDFYERYPYPPPVDQLDQYQPLWADPSRRRQEHHLLWPRRPYRDDRSILVAGCGTAQAAKYAMRWPAARVTGIDFSATSVRCTEALKRKYDLENLHVVQLPIERVGELNTSFDQIVCTGVLHHLANPVDGLRALRAALEPDGTMLLVVYAPYGRAGIYMMQEFCRRVGIGANDDGIRDLITALGALPPEHPLQRLVRESLDFRREASIADALLHPRDRAYSVPQLFEFLESGGLAFERWTHQAPYSTRCGVMARLPQATRIAQLAPVEQFAAAELFRGSMLRHSLVACRSDRDDRGRSVGFEGDAWLHYVPIRMADTVSVRTRQPVGTAAVLINRYHIYTDIHLSLDAHEKRWFDAIDGERTIGEIADAQGERATGRALFERLWWHDQVVFDASRSEVSTAPVVAPRSSDETAAFSTITR